jgi:lambda repressor-like predicted transcriptional regulator
VTAKEVASWSRKAREATLRRDGAIRAMRAEGATLRAIAEAAGLTHTAIAKILSREADASGAGAAL